MNPNTKLTLLLLSLIVLLPAMVFGQSFQASVSGIVTDPTGAVVPNVKITVADTERGASFSTMANQDGVYVINNLIPSKYTITAEAPGFQTHQVNSFPLAAKQEAVVNIRVVAAQARGNRVHLGLRLRERHAALQLADHIVIFAPAILRGRRRHRQRQQDVGIFRAAQRGQYFARQREPARHHPDDVVIAPIQCQGAADHARVAAEAACPRAISQDGGGGWHRGVLARFEKPSGSRPGAQHAQQVCRDANGADTFRLARTGEVGIAADRDGELLEPAGGRHGYRNTAPWKTSPG